MSHRGRARSTHTWSCPAKEWRPRECDFGFEAKRIGVCKWVNQGLTSRQHPDSRKMKSKLSYRGPGLSREIPLLTSGIRIWSRGAGEPAKEQRCEDFLHACHETDD